MDRMYRLTARGEGVIASDNLAALKGLKLGDTIEIAAPNGLLRLPIAGIVIDYSDQRGSLLVDRAVLRRYWNDDSVNIFRLYLKPGAKESEVKERLLARFAGERRLFVFTSAELRRFILDLTDQWLALT